MIDWHTIYFFNRLNCQLGFHKYTMRMECWKCVCCDKHKDFTEQDRENRRNRIYDYKGIAIIKDF